ncbi:MAG: hypothetical protein GY765_13610 [bacterium]|nr:hypothetical protein [bacterium]
MAETLKNPFPGLRPFEEEEEKYFFGRENAVADLMTQLRCSRFLAVLGPSGSGKSSLITAGLLPALYRGFMADAGSRWRVAFFRPGGNPVGNLARALGNTLHSHIEEDGADKEALDRGDAVSRRFMETTLRRSSHGLIEAVKQARLPGGENLLIVVDQFEELFRFGRMEQENPDGKRDSSVFVKLLLETRKQTDLPIFIILTMRSDFLGDCTTFMGLPEAVNNGQYLIPRMTRDEKRAAVSGPVAVNGGKISTPLMSRLLNDVGDNPDQLPILQHALMRTWDYWARRRGDESMDISHYEAVGTMAGALSQHAEEAYGQLKNDRARLLCEKLFKLITDAGDSGRGVRRPAKLSEICLAADASPKEMVAVIDRFRQPGRTFLMPPQHIALEEDTVIDISHESLMRIWERLKGWVKEEAQSAELYDRLATAAALHEAGEVGLWRDPELMLALQWRQENRPNTVWAQRYHPGFELASAFMEASEKQQELELAEKERAQRAKIKLTRIIAALIAVAAVIAVVFGLWALKNKHFAEEQQEIAEEQQKIAEVQKDKAEKEKKEADRNRLLAQQQKEIAVKNQGEAETQRHEAERQKELALQSERLAKIQRKKAEVQKEIAEHSRTVEQLQSLIVAMNKEEAKFRRLLTKTDSLSVQSISREADNTLKGLLALTAYRTRQAAFNDLEAESKAIFTGFDKSRLDAGKEEQTTRYREMEDVYKKLCEVFRRRIVSPEVFQALREAYLAAAPVGDVLASGVESWVLAVAGDTAFYNTMDGELKAVTLRTPKNGLPAAAGEKTVPTGRSPLRISALQTADGNLYYGGGGAVFVLDQINGKTRQLDAGRGETVLALVFCKKTNRLFYSVKDTIYGIAGGASGAAEPVFTSAGGVFIRALALIEAAESGGAPLLIAADAAGHIYRGTVTDRLPRMRRIYKTVKGDGLYCMAWNPVRKILALGKEHGDILLFSAVHRDDAASRTGKENRAGEPVVLKKKHGGIIRALAFSADGRFLASGGFDGNVLLWDMEGRQLREDALRLPMLRIHGDDKILALAFSTDGNALLFCDKRHLRVCPTSPEPFRILLKNMFKRDLSPDEKRLYLEDLKKEPANDRETQ